MDLNDGGAGTAEDLAGGGASGGSAGGGGGGAAGGGGDGGGAGSAADLAGGGSGGDGGQGGGAGGDGGSGGDGGANPEWLTQFSTDIGEGEKASMQDWVKSIGVKDVNGLAKIARDNMRAVREGGQFKVPGEGATEEEVTAYRAAIGVPEKPDGYAIPQPKDADGNPIPVNSALTERVAALAHKHGVPKTALDAILEEEIAAQVAELDDAKKALAEKAGEHVKGWGEKRDANLAQINAAAKDIGLSRQDMEYLRGIPSGPGKALDMLAKFGANFSEDSLIQGDSKTFGMSAEQAQAELDTINADKALRDKAVVPGTPENARYTRANEALAAHAKKKAGAS